MNSEWTADVRFGADSRLKSNKRHFRKGPNPEVVASILSHHRRGRAASAEWSSSYELGVVAAGLFAAFSFRRTVFFPCCKIINHYA